jgi:catechol 2,3-dioxygenase-like lactoylglutathione lyase family enzyme
MTSARRHRADRPPPISSVYETVLYGGDVEAMKDFYVDVLGLRLVDGPDELSAAFRLRDGGMLLVFDPRRSGAPGRQVPSHGTAGGGHVAFRVSAGSLDRWEARFTGHGIAVDRDVEWPAGGRSLYVRDPAGNSVELTADELWAR